ESFQEQVPPEAARIWTMDVWRQIASRGGHMTTSLIPRDYVRALDESLLAIDGQQYITRAKNAKTHFHDPTSSVTITLTDAATGDLDNSLAQLMAHHARSLQLAARSQREPDAALRRTMRTEALLEHAFALHFIEDGMAAGHIVTDPAVAVDQKRAQRHDYFNREGLGVTRALTQLRCSEPSDAPAWTGAMLDRCWIAHGDGFASAEDRIYVDEAVARIQTAFALALKLAPLGTNEAKAEDAQIEPEVKDATCRDWASMHDTPEQCDIAWQTVLLDPLPGLTKELPASCKDHRDEEGQPDPMACWAKKARDQFRRALDVLVRAAPLLPADAGSPEPQPGALTSAVLGDPLPILGVDKSKDRCEAGPADQGGSKERDARCIAYLWVPLLTDWPDSQADATTLQGSDSFGRGLKVQILASLAATYAGPFEDTSAVSAWGGAGVGVTYSAQGIFPARHTRALVEANVGVAEGVMLAGQGQQFRSVGVAEVRTPVGTLLLFGLASAFRSGSPLDLLGTNVFGNSLTLGVMGARLYWALQDTGATLTGWDAEVLNFLLSPNEPARAAVGADILQGEGRVRIGWRSDDPRRPLRSMFGGSFVLAFEVNSGLFF
ncbi:MAG TPA: hypothetical protein VKU41_32765, partial [Polyangiaceae bacterium]|nr:hypothetical protein [Polyangiaceae bacterium]